MWSVTLRLLWFFGYFFTVLQDFTIVFFHHFVKLLGTFLPKDASISPYHFVGFLVYRKSNEMVGIRDVVSYVTSFVVLSIIFEILHRFYSW